MLIWIVSCVLSAQFLSTRAVLFSTACNVAAFGLITCALLIGTTPKKTFVDCRVLRFFGWLSYGLYLVHVFAFNVIDVVFGRWWWMLHPFSNPVAAILLRFVLGSALAIGVA